MHVLSKSARKNVQSVTNFREGIDLLMR